jgi:hypothetical protein
MDRNRWIGIAVLAAVLAFAAGFLPQWQRARTLDRDLTATRHELATARLQGRLGAAVTESMRSNYERSRQLMTDFFRDAQAHLAAVEDPRQRQELQGMLRERDELITLLARSEPESTQRLMLLYTRFFTAFDPAAERAPTSVTPSPTVR